MSPQNQAVMEHRKREGLRQMDLVSGQELMADRMPQLERVEPQMQVM